MINIYTKLFNLVFQTGIVPDAWTLDIIKALYKQKGDKSQPENYRGIQKTITFWGKIKQALDRDMVSVITFVYLKI